MSVSCSICLDAYSTDEGVITLSGCGHVFHHVCLNQWKTTSKLNPPKCPLCQKNYNKRSLTRLYFHLEENLEDNQALKKQKTLTESLQKDKENLESEIQRKQAELERVTNSWTFVYQELTKMKTEYGIKCQAYNIIDTVNNEYLQSNEKLQSENASLKQETVKLKMEIEELKSKNLGLLKAQKREKQVVDLTADDDDDVVIVESGKKSDSDIIEINDEEEEEEVPSTTTTTTTMETRTSPTDEQMQQQQQQEGADECNSEELKNEEDSGGDVGDEGDARFLKPLQEIDYTNFENFLMSQI